MGEVYCLMEGMVLASTMDSPSTVRERGQYMELMQVLGVMGDLEGFPPLTTANLASFLNPLHCLLVLLSGRFFGFCLI